MQAYLLFIGFAWFITRFNCFVSLSEITDSSMQHVAWSSRCDLICIIIFNLFFFLKNFWLLVSTDFQVIHAPFTCRFWHLIVRLHTQSIRITYVYSKMDYRELFNDIQIWTQNVFWSWLLCELILTIFLYIKENVLFENYTVLWCTKCKLAAVTRPLPRSIPIMIHVQKVKVKVQPFSTKRQEVNRKRFFVTLGFEGNLSKIHTTILRLFRMPNSRLQRSSWQTITSLYDICLRKISDSLGWLWSKYVRYII